MTQKNSNRQDHKRLSLLRRLVLRILLRYKYSWSDKTYLRIMYWDRMGKRLNLKNPKTFSEKLQWLKLYDRRPEYTIMVDKVKAKEYVASKLGDEYIIPTLGVWDDPDKIDFDALPDRFVLKCNHNSGLGMYICKDKSKMDVEKVKEELRKGLAEDYFINNREWPYKDVPRRILAEKFIDPTPNVQDLPDYKWYCFNGEPKYCQVIQDRSIKETIDFYDTEWQHQDFIGLMPVIGSKFSFADTKLARPIHLETHLRIARELSKNIPFSRIDLYETGENTYFGEITFYPMSGFGVFEPDQYNELLGQMIKLPGEKRVCVGGVIINELQNGEIQIAEPDLADYKFFCFDGKVKMLYVATERQKKGEVAKFDFFDEKFNHLSVQQAGHPNAAVTPQKPKNFEKMKEMSEKLSQGIPHLRVDFYDCGDRIYWGEMTFFSMSGMSRYEPEQWDSKIGDWLKLE